MQGQMTRPTDPAHISYAGTPDELWWSGSDWIKPPVSSAPATVKLSQVVQVYSAIRDARAAKRHAYEAEDNALDEDQRKLKVLMLALLNETGAKSIATDHGTVYRTEKLKPSGADWGAIWDWMKANDAPELLERRIKATFIKEYMDEHEGAIPPGINVHREYEVSVRRPNASAAKD